MEEGEALKKRIEAARAYAGFASQGDLGKAIDMHPKSFQRRLRGEYSFRRADLLAIAEVCEVPMWFLERGFEGATSPGRAEAGSVAEGLDIERRRAGGEGELGHG